MELYCVLILLLVFFCSETKSGMVCQQDERGEETTIHCESEMFPYCCVLNGKMSCCAYDHFTASEYAKLPALITIITLISLLLIVTSLRFCYLKISSLQATKKNSFTPNNDEYFSND